MAINFKYKIYLSNNLGTSYSLFYETWRPISIDLFRNHFVYKQNHYNLDSLETVTNLPLIGDDFNIFLKSWTVYTFFANSVVSM